MDRNGVCWRRKENEDVQLNTYRKLNLRREGVVENESALLLEYAQWIDLVCSGEEERGV